MLRHIDITTQPTTSETTLSFFLNERYTTKGGMPSPIQEEAIHHALFNHKSASPWFRTFSDRWCDRATFRFTLLTLALVCRDWCNAIRERVATLSLSAGDLEVVNVFKTKSPMCHVWDRIQYLDIYGGQLQKGVVNSLKETLVHMNVLSSLHLANIEITSTTLNEIMSSLSPSVQLRSLEIGHNSLRSGVENTLLKRCGGGSLTHLDISNNYHQHVGILSTWGAGGQGAVSSLCDALAGMPLRVLNVAFTGLSHEGLVMLTKNLSGSPHMTHLDLSCNRIRSSPALRELASLTKLSRLNLASNQLETLSNVGYLIEILPQLTHLDLSSNSLSDADIQSLLCGPRLPKLSCLNLSHNEIGMDGIRALGEMLARSELRHFDMSHNLLCYGSALDALVDLLRVPTIFRSLRVLDCSGNALLPGHPCLPRFATLVKRMKQLTYLNIGWGALDARVYELFEGVTLEAPE